MGRKGLKSDLKQKKSMNMYDVNRLCVQLVVEKVCRDCEEKNEAVNVVNDEWHVKKPLFSWAMWWVSIAHCFFVADVLNKWLFCHQEHFLLLCVVLQFELTTFFKKSLRQSHCSDANSDTKSLFSPLFSQTLLVLVKAICVQLLIAKEWKIHVHT